MIRERAFLVWKTCFVLAFLLFAPDQRVPADDTANLSRFRAAMKQRVADLRTLKITYETDSAVITWEAAGRNERIESVLTTDPDQSRSIFVSTESGSKNLWLPSTGSGKEPKATFWGKGVEPNRPANFMARVLCSSCTRAGEAFDTFVDREGWKSIAHGENDPGNELVFSYSGIDRIGKPMEFVVTVDTSRDWVPIKTQCKSKSEIGEGKVRVVTEEMVVTQTQAVNKSGSSIVVPATAEIETHLSDLEDRGPLLIHISKFELPDSIPSTDFLLSIPAEAFVHEFNVKGRPAKEYYFGGAAIEQKVTESRSAQANQMLSQVKKIVEDAERPEPIAWFQYGWCVVFLALTGLALRVWRINAK